MKKKLLIAFIALVLVLAAGFGISYLLSLHKVTFTLKEGTDSIVVYASNNKEMKQLSSDGYLSLQAGEYYVIPEGKNIASDKIPFSVKQNDTSLAVNPSYTKNSLADKLSKETDAIKAAITKKYPSALTDYTLAQGELYEQGQWFGGLLKPKVSDIREQKDPYRIVLQKKDDQWEILRRPEYVLTSSRYEEVPVDILRKINAIVGEPGN